jgi:anthranilate synthase
MDLLKYYQSALLSALKPTLLEFKHPRKNSMLRVCAIDPLMTLEVKNGRLYKNGLDVGEALDIFDYLNAPQKESPAFFPAYLGFFTYEFASYFDLTVHSGPRRFPDAYFRLYEKGLVVDDDDIIHHDPLPHHDLPNTQKVDLQCLTPALTKESFLTAVEIIKSTIKNGELYQLNLSMPFYFENADVSPLTLYGAMRKLNPSPFMGLIEHDDWAIISGSPERLFSYGNQRLSARPIAGTKKRGGDQNSDDEIMMELLDCPKENAEHAMLVDLMRNDINQVSEPKTVNVDEDRSVEFYSHVMHLVSQVSGQCERSLKEVVQALFPGGTITGAPKKSVMNAIALLEHAPRGPYTGSLGYISAGFGTDLNILIRSVLKAQERMWINSGAGIVIDSDPESEWREVHRKAGFIKDILQHSLEAKPPRENRIGPARRLRTLDAQKCPEKQLPHVLFVENQDSFSFNIIAALKNLGAKVAIIGPDEEFQLTDFSHVVIGPGPGNPEHLPKLQQFIKVVLEQGLPTLGICLGHQAIGHYFGANIMRCPPIHGQSLPIRHSEERLFYKLKSPTHFTRYHSLAVSQAPSDFLVDGVSEDDCIMAISHKSLPIFGVQFHPESYLSEDGHVLLNNFLRIK